MEALRIIQRSAQDPDWEFFQLIKGGVTLGVMEQLPRTPAVFEEKSKWRLDEFLTGAVLEASNYSSLEAHLDEVQKQFEEEEKESMMVSFTGEEFLAEFKWRYALAALAVRRRKTN